MDRFELSADLKEEIRARVLGEGFMKIVQSVRRGGKVFRVSMRPVEIGGERMFQAEMTDDGRVMVKNFPTGAAAEGLEQMIAQRGARDLHLITAKGDLHLRVTKKGRQLVTRSAEMDRVAVVRPHDRVKKLPLNEFDSSVLLRAIGISDAEGRIKASMRAKYDQVNEFLRAVAPVVKPGQTESFTVVDCGCGKAYLTLALSCYLSEALGMKGVRVIGVDRRADVVKAARDMAGRLDLGERAEFVESDIAEYSPPEGVGVDMVVSLHACDTATDEALAKAVEWKAGYVFSVPCCQHELQKTIASAGGAGAAVFSGLFRQNILKERLSDILTDAFRAMIMRILGFKTQVVEFVSSEATARNIMIKCEYCVKPGQAGPIGEYLELRDYWKVVPWLESRLGKSLGRYLERYS